MDAIGYVQADAGEVATGGAGAGLEAQRAAIEAACAARLWNLLSLHEDVGPSRTGLRGALADVAASPGRALVVAKLDRICPELRDLEPLRARAAAERWELVALDFGLDTVTESGRKVVDYLIWAAGLARPDEFETPPRELIYRITGTDNSEWFLVSAEAHVQAFEDVLHRLGRSYADVEHALDFGCGCGRLLRALRRRVEGRLSGSDIDAEAVAWMKTRFPEIDGRTNEPLPPLPFEDGSFDLAVSFSVFTHLDRRYQDAWLRELQRVTRPGAVLLVTVNGELAWLWHREHALTGSAVAEKLERSLRRHGFAYWRTDGWNSVFPDFYHTSWHMPRYVRDHWSKWFEVVDHRPAAAGPTQDLVVLRRDARPRGGRLGASVRAAASRLRPVGHAD